VSERRDELIDEALLRRALRFEAGEPTPRFDPAAIAALARPRAIPAVALAGVIFAVAIAVTASTVWSVASALAPDVWDGVVSLLLDGVTGLASLLYPVTQAVTDPAVPLSLIAATAVAIYHEMQTRRERAHVHAS
jgi:hypothetical protein